MDECVTKVWSNPQAAVELAMRWRDAESGSAKIMPLQCLGIAESEREHWAAAEAAFIAARDIAAASEYGLRARLGEDAGNAALAGGSGERGLAIFDAALVEAAKLADPNICGELQAGRSRALVALGRIDDAAASLALARVGAPDSSEVWLLSATLSRRMGKLADAQTQIEVAAGLLPTDPDIGLEAGVIAVLSGRDEAARKSWQSVIDASPQSDAALAAKGYLAQLAAN